AMHAAASFSPGPEADKSKQALASFHVGAGQPLLEAQVVDAADSLAYDTHDVDDALSLGLITLDDLAQVRFWARAVERMRQQHPRLAEKPSSLQFQPTAVRALIDWQVSDLLEQSRANLRKQAVRDLRDVRDAGKTLVTPGEEVRALKAELEKFLH